MRIAGELALAVDDVCMGMAGTDEAGSGPRRAQRRLIMLAFRDAKSTCP